MARLSQRAMEELREVCSLKCDHGGAEEIMNKLVRNIVEELCTEPGIEPEEIELYWDEYFISTLDVFACEFWERAVEVILKVVATQEDGGGTADERTGG